jgi:hypothetical protein
MFIKQIPFYRKVLSSVLAATAAFSWLAPVWAGPVLKGNVQELNNVPGQSAPGLKRTDIAPSDDAFSQGSDKQQINPPSFAVEDALPPPPKKSFPLSAQDEGNADSFDPRMMSAVPDQMQQQAPPRELNTTTPNQFAPQDPDSSPEMQLAWDEWHRRVAGAIYQRYATLSNAAFHSTGRPLMAVVDYVVTRDGRICNAHLIQPSGNAVYNALILGVVNSIAGDMSILAFPLGSRRMMVEKSGTFSQNYGHEGFRYTTNDRETIRQR